MQGGVQTKETMSAFDHQLGDMVFLKHDPEENARMVTGIVIRPNGVLYQLSMGSTETSHYSVEVTKERKSDNKPGAGFRK